MSKSAKPVRTAKSGQPLGTSAAESSDVEEASAPGPAMTEKPVQPVLKPTPRVQLEPAQSELFDNPVYTAYASKTVQDAAEAFRIARLFSLVLFGAGAVLLVVSLLFGIFTADTTQTILFGILGTVILIALIVYRPIERIRGGSEALLRAQFAALAFAAQSEIALRGLKSNDPENRSRAAQALQDAAAQFGANLESGTPMISTSGPGATRAQK